MRLAITIILHLVVSTPVVAQSDSDVFANEIVIENGVKPDTGDGVLSAQSRDILTIVGAIGAFLTAVGVFLAWWQMRKTSSATKAAAKAAVSALDESRKQYNKYVVAQASRILAETRVYLKQEEWQLVTVRMSDLADLLIQVAGDDPSWADLGTRLHNMEASLERIAKGQIGFSNSLQGKWQKLQTEIRSKVAMQYGPIPDKI